MCLDMGINVGERQEHLYLGGPVFWLLNSAIYMFYHIKIT